jgi:hypothetical protein
MTTLFGETPTEADIEISAQQGVDMFLRGYGAPAQAVA